MIVSVFVLSAFWGSALAQPEPAYVSRFDAGGLDLGEGVAIADDGRVAVTGIGGPSEQQDFVTAFFAADGSLLWSRTVDEGTQDRGGGVAIDSSGNVYAVGTTRASGDDVILLKYSPAGNLTWSLRFDKGTSETARAIALDGQGNVIIAGSSISANGGDGFVAKFSPNGEEIWAKPVNLFWLDEFFAVTTDGEGNVIAAGRVASGGSFNAIVRKFNPEGATVWTQYVVGESNVEGRGVAADANGNVFVTGTATLYEGTTARKDLVIAKFDREGSELWKKNYELGGDDEGRAAVADTGGNVLVTGFSNVNGNKDPFLLKVDGKGERVWRQTTPGAGIDGTGSISISPRGDRIAIAGATQRDGANFDYLVITYEQGRPSAAFKVGAGSPTVNATISFEDLSVPDKVPIVSREWDFGDGNTSTAANPSHKYTQNGTYNVRLTVRDAWGNEHVAQRALTVGSSLGPGTSPGATTDPVVKDPEPPQESIAPKPGAGKFILIFALFALAVVATALILLKKRRGGQ